ncbi:MAG: GGDEF domain-containing protein, partial [Firmicutes bacterium]|nr:GGDEF domain-containing protein [Bacillota bacterium]
LGYITIAALFIAASPLLLFIKERFVGRKKALLLITAFAVCVSAIIALICQVFGIAELRETLIVCHIMLIVCLAVLVLVSVTRNNKKAGEAKLHGLILLLSVGALADLLYFYWKKNSSGTIFTVTALLIYAVVRFVSEFLNINRKSYTDTHTGLFNRNRWNALMNNSDPISEATGVMMLDLNCLKHINDTMGHKMGDKMILDFANILRENLPADCMIFRWGGDEFTVLVSDADSDKMDRLVSQISAVAEAHNLSGEKPEIHFAAGYALSVDYPTFSYEELLKKADEKMYHNKSEWYSINVPDYHL